MKRHHSFRNFPFLRVALLMLSFGLLSCQVSPKWAAQGQGQGPAYRPTVPPAYSNYYTASTVARPAPVVMRRPQVMAPQASFQSPPKARGRVRLVNGRAIAPVDAPPVVRRVVEAGNRMQSFPYKWGGGHAVLNDSGYDCSGAVSYVLREAGIMPDQRNSRGFLNFGQAGQGEWITVWAKDGHVFIMVGGLRLDTGGSTQRTGPRWKPQRRHYTGFVPRHPRGL